MVALFARADTDLYEFKAHRGEIVELPTTVKPPLAAIFGK